MHAIKAGQAPMDDVDLYGGIQDLLSAWGKCRAINDASHVYFPPVSAFARQMRNSGQAGPRPLQLPETLMHRIDSAVCALRRRSEGVKGDNRYKVLTLYYCVEDGRTLSESAIARKLRISRDRVRTARIAAENWLERAVLDTA